jgi:hypothetical protein
MMPLERIGEFGDIRRAERGAWLFDRIVSTGSLVFRRVGGDRAGEMAAHRFLASPAVTAVEIIQTLGGRTGAQCQGRRIIAVQDTTEINFSGRARARRGLGPAGDGQTPGFFVAVWSPSIAKMRPWSACGTPRSGPGTAGKRAAARRQRRLDEKESQRWLSATKVVAEPRAGAHQLIVVGDRESDIFALFARRPAGVGLVVRAAQDRALADGTRLFAQPAAWPALGMGEVRVGPRGPGDKGRVATLTVRAGPIRVRRPHNGGDPHDPQYLDLSLVEAREERPPRGTAAIHWRLITTLPVADRAAAEEIIQIYRLRWRIEQVFRASKSDGVELPDVQVHDADRLFSWGRWPSPPRYAPSNWSMPARAAPDRPPMLPARTPWRPPRRLRSPWKARRRGRKIPTRPAPWRGCRGLSPDWAAGIATTSRPAPRRCAPVGIGSPRWSPGSPSL